MKKKLFIIITLVIITIALLITLIVIRLNNLDTYKVTEGDKINETCKNQSISTREIDKTLANTKLGDLNIYIPAKMYLDDQGLEDEKLYTNDEYGHTSNPIDEISLRKTDYSLLEDLEKIGRDKGIDAKSILNEYKIENNIDILKALKDSNNTIFTPVNKMKLNYLVKMYAMDMYCEENDEVKEAETTLVINKSSDKYSLFHYEISAIKGNKEYLITLDETKLEEKSRKIVLTEEEINKIISSIYID